MSIIADKRYKAIHSIHVKTSNFWQKITGRNYLFFDISIKILSCIDTDIEIRSGYFSSNLYGWCQYTLIYTSLLSIQIAQNSHKVVPIWEPTIYILPIYIWQLTNILSAKNKIWNLEVRYFIQIFFEGTDFCCTEDEDYSGRTSSNARKATSHGDKFDR